MSGPGWTSGGRGNRGTCGFGDASAAPFRPAKSSRHRGRGAPEAGRIVSPNWIGEARARYDAGTNGGCSWPEYLDVMADALLEQAITYYGEADTRRNAAQRAVSEIDRYLYIAPIWDDLPGPYPDFLDAYDRRLAELRTMRYADYLLTPEWLATRATIRERFGGRCAVCNSARSLQVHHRTYERRGEEDIRDLTLLCADCHSRFHGR